MTTNTMHATTDFPALDGRPVTEAHARTCRERGHATHTIDGRDSHTCPRCGEVKSSANHPTVDLPAHLEGPRLPTTYGIAFRCSECGRSWTVADDSNEWAFGHDCE